MVRNPGMSASIERVAYLQLRNTLLMLREHFGRRHALFRIGVALVQLPMGMVHAPARGLHWSPRGRLLAIRDHLRKRYGPHRRRPVVKVGAAVVGGSDAGCNPSQRHLIAYDEASAASSATSSWYSASTLTSHTS